MNKMTKGMGLLAVLFFMFGTAMAQKKPQMGKSDPKAEAILKGVTEKYKTFKTIRAVFTLKIESPDNEINEEQSGTLYLKGDKYKLEMANQEIVTNTETIWTYLKDANEVQINSYEVDDNTITPSQIFTIYENNFLYVLAEETTVDGKAVQIIDLTPYDKERPYFKIRLTIDKNEKQIMSMKVFDKNGNRYTYTIKKFKPNLELSDTFFTFDPSKYPDIEIVDLR